MEEFFYFLLWLLLIFGPLIGSLWIGYELFTLRLRRQERAHIFLDILETTLDKGLSLEETIISISEKREASLGIHFHLLAFYLKDGLSLGDAIGKARLLLPSQVTAMIQTGLKIGDVHKVFPACRQLTKDALSQTRGVANYLLLFAFLAFPINLLITFAITTSVIPLLKSICSGMLDTAPQGLIVLDSYSDAILAWQVFLFIVIWVLTFAYIDGFRTFAWLDRWFSPLNQRVIYGLPWRRKRFQRDFASILSVLIDAGVSESDAITLAADCTGNIYFRRRAAGSVDGLRRGLKLTEAVALVDDSGEFRWRLVNAIKGWLECLDAKAFQQQQAVSQLVTTGVVLVNGLVVGLIVVSVFSILVFIIEGALLW